MQQLKTWCDPQGFNANRKYAGGDHITIKRLVVTSNFTIRECMKPGLQGGSQVEAALYRRFREVHIRKLLCENNIRLRSKEELTGLKKAGNQDYKKCFEPVNTDLAEIDVGMLPTIKELDDFEEYARENLD